jgi:hypothetical protein
MMLTGIEHTRRVDASDAFTGWLKDKPPCSIFVSHHGSFGQIPHHFSVSQARAMIAVLSDLVAEFDAYDAAMDSEYGHRITTADKLEAA